MKTPLPSAGADAGRRSKLSERIAAGLRQDYLFGQVPVGRKLPTETRLAERFDVSRTVVREAIAALAADGLVETRQGSGTFVLAYQPAPPALPLEGEHARHVSHALDVLEVRIALEMESAALAAIRRSSAQEAQIHERFFAFDRVLALGQPTGSADFAFHRAIAEATNNAFYVEVLDSLGARTIPCGVTSPYAAEDALSPTYQTALQREHLAILNAISAGDAGAARDAMRVHLSSSQERYRRRLQEWRMRHRLQG